MSSTCFVNKFSELEVYKKQRVLSSAVFRLTKEFPPEERFALTDQLRRAARSIGGQIAEAWAKRRYPKHFVSKLTDADAEQMETQHWLIEALECDYVSEAEFDRLIGLCEEIGRMLGSMIHKAESFVPKNWHLKDEPFELSERFCLDNVESTRLTTDD